MSRWSARRWLIVAVLASIGIAGVLIWLYERSEWYGPGAPP